MTLFIQSLRFKSQEVVVPLLVLQDLSYRSIVPCRLCWRHQERTEVPRTDSQVGGQ